MTPTMMRRIVLRHFMRCMLLSKHGHTLSDEVRKAIQAALRNRSAEDLILDGCEELHGGPLLDAVIEFFQWLLDHADEIIALILKLLPLFTDA